MRKSGKLGVGIAVVVCVVADAGYWSIQTSPTQCSASWYFGNGHAIRVVENANTRALRAFIYPDLDPNQPIVQFWLDSASGGPRPVFDKWHLPLGDQVQGYEDFGIHRRIDAEVRMQPDDGTGFVPVTLWRETGRFGQGVHYIVHWAGFEWHDRFRRWSVAKETSDDAGVRVPEVRVILKWNIPDEEPDSRDEEEYPRDGDHWMEIPLWRTSNMLNKIERCRAALRLD